MRSVVTEVAGSKVLRDFSSYTLHCVVHRFRGPIDRFGHFFCCQAIKIVTQNLRFELGQLLANTSKFIPRILLIYNQIFRICLG